MKTFEKATEETKAKFAVQMVILDAIEKGHTDAKEMAEYMKSETFFNAVANYLKMMN